MKISVKRYLSMIVAFALLVTGVIPAYAVTEGSGGVANHVVINQVYGSGGLAGAAYKYDFVELYNPMDTAQNLTGWTLQYASATSTLDKEFSQSVDLTGTIQPRSYYLIRLATEGSNGNDILDFSVEKNINLSGSNGKIALVSSSTKVKTSEHENIVDFVGYGSTATDREPLAGTTASNALSPTKTESIARKSLGVDTNNNNADFVKLSPPNPRNGMGTPVNETKCAEPTASVAAGPVLANTKVTFSTTTSGAAVEYNTTSETADQWTSGSAITVTLTQDTTYYVRAVKDGLEPSPVKTFAYTIDNELRLTATPSGTDAVSGATLKLACNDPKAKIYYSIDGSDVTNGSSLYSDHILLEGNIGAKITVKAIAMAEGKVDSALFDKTYTIKDPNAVMSIKDVLALKETTENVEVKGTIVYFATGFANPVINAVIDNKTYGLYIYKAPVGAKIGDEVRFKGKYEIRSEMPQISQPSSMVIIGKGSKIEPKEMTISQINKDGLGMIGQVVKIKNAKLGKYDAKSTPITDSTGTISIYSPTAYPVQVVEGDTVDVYAMIGAFNTTVQLYTGTSKDNGFNVYDVANDTKAPVVTLRDTYPNAKPAQDYVIAAKVEDNKGVKDVKLSYTMGSKTVTDQNMVYVPENNEYSFTIPGDQITKNNDDFKFVIKATDVTGLNTTTAAKSVLIDARPQIVKVLPARNGSTGDVKNPQIQVSLSNEGKDPLVTMTLKKDKEVIVDKQKMLAGTEVSTYVYQTTTLTDGLYTVEVTVKRDDNSTNTATWNFTVGTPKFRAYFGQLHGHTSEYSDGSGTLANGLSYLKSLPESEKVDFASFTDHSNYFDTASEINPAAAMNDKTKMTAGSLEKWNKYVSTMEAFNAENAGSVLAFPGYEMTWSGGPGHINTFNSVGLVSRNNSDLNNKKADAGLKAYYDELIKNPDPLANLSQFNHPGTTFGTFADFAYWSAAIDDKMVSVEVGNGEGAIGSGGYFPSYTEYTKALDKGWHVAPTNNQDNHKGRWGNANTARTVIITDNLSQEGLLKGLKNMSVYATEDQNLNIQYTVNDQMMGSIIAEVPTTPLRFYVNVDDPDATDSIAKIEVITNSGRIVESKAFNGNAAEWSFELPPNVGYYYLRVTQADKNMAVTAPIWIGQAPKVGINSVETNTKIPVTNEELKISTTLFNSEAQPATLKSITYSIGDEIIKQDTTEASITAASLFKHELAYTPTKVGQVKMTVTAVILVDGQERTFTQDIELNVRDASKLVCVGVDASHYNEYVRGNYKDSMTNLANLAMGYDVRVVELGTSEELIAATKNPKYQMMILTPPTRRNGTAFLSGYKNYTNEEIAAIKAFAELGKTVIVSGWSDNYENYSQFTDKTPFKLPGTDQMSAQQNKLLAALGSTLRISDDEIQDPVTNGGSAQRLYLNNYNLENPYVKGVKEAVQVYSNYGGASIYAVDEANKPTSTLPASVSPIVYGFTTSISVDKDKDGYTGTSGPAIQVPKYNDKLMVAASETINYGNGNKATVVVAGAVFMSNFEIKAEFDNWATPEYSNFTILENILKAVNPVTISDIKAVHEVGEGVKFTIQGIVTSNASGFDKDTAFFDTVYVQDGTAGIDLFPVAGNVRAGQIVQVTGVTSSYNGERQLNVQKFTIVDSTINPLPQPIQLTTAQASKAQKLGSLVKVTGVITKLDYSNGVIESIYVADGSGVVTRIFIDGYITKDKTITNLQVGANVTAIGLSSIDTEGARIRVRDRGDVVCTPAKSEKEDRPSKNTDTGSSTPTPAQPTNPVTPVTDNKAADAAKEKAKATGKLTDAEKSIFKEAIKTELKAQADSNKLEDRKQFKENVALLNKVLGNVEAKQELLANPEALSKAIATSVENLKKDFVATGLSEKTAKPIVTLESTTDKISLSLQAADLKVAKDNGADFKVATADASVKVASADLNAEKACKVAIEKDASLRGTAPKQMSVVTEGVKLDTEFKAVELAIPVETAKAKTLGVFKLDEAKKTYVLVQSQIDSATGSLVVTGATNGQYVVAEVKSAFADTSKTWAKDTITQVAARRIMVGLADDKFAPEKTVTKAEFAAALLSVIGKADPNAKDWKASSVAAANQLGFGATFLNDKTADKAITREEMAYMMAKAYGYKANFELQASTLSFKDAKQVNKALLSEVAKAQQLGFVKGTPDGSFKPASTGTRAEAAQMLLNLASNL